MYRKDPQLLSIIRRLDPLVQGDRVRCVIILRAGHTIVPTYVQHNTAIKTVDPQWYEIAHRMSPQRKEIINSMRKQCSEEIHSIKLLILPDIPPDELQYYSTNRAFMQKESNNFLYTVYRKVDTN